MITSNKKYFNWLKNELENFSKEKNIRVFLFGSSLGYDHFNDIDVALEGDVSAQEIMDLKNHFEESTFPYNIDLVNLNEVKKSFKKNILNQPVLWIKQ